MFKPAAAPEPTERALPELPFQELSEGLPPSGAWSGRPLLYDFTSDGRCDLVASNCEEAGYACWRSPSAPGQSWERCDDGLPSGLGCAAAGAADVDGDGHPDLALSSSAQGLRIFLGDGQMHWRASEQPLPETPTLGRLASGDLDGDGLVDLVALGYPRGGLFFFYGDKAGRLQRAAGAELLAESDYGRELVLADLDLDGRADLVLATGAGVRVFLCEGARPPRWREQSRGLPAPACPDSVRALCAGRFSDDPRPQIAVCCEPDPRLAPAERDAIGVYAWSADRAAWEHIDSGLPRGDRYCDLAAADFDGDGKLDLVALSPEHGAAIYLGDGRGGFRARGRLAGVHGRGRLGVGHIDQNLLPDIVVAVPAGRDEPQGGGLRAFLNRRPVWLPR
jgi:hypothetical protein